MSRTIALYLATFAVMVPLDFLFLGVLAKGFFHSQVGAVMGELRLAPAVLFYLLYTAGILVFVSATATSWQQAALFGALLGCLCYATFDLTSLALIKGWTWKAAIVDISWGTFVTATSAAAGVAIVKQVLKLG